MEEVKAAEPVCTCGCVKVYYFDNIYIGNIYIFMKDGHVLMNVSEQDVGDYDFTELCVVALYVYAKKTSDDVKAGRCKLDDYVTLQEAFEIQEENMIKRKTGRCDDLRQIRVDLEEQVRDKHNPLKDCVRVPNGGGGDCAFLAAAQVLEYVYGEKLNIDKVAGLLREQVVEAVLSGLLNGEIVPLYLEELCTDLASAMKECDKMRKRDRYIHDVFMEKLRSILATKYKIAIDIVDSNGNVMRYDDEDCKHHFFFYLSSGEHYEFMLPKSD